jgi:hypothetical protein
VARVEADSQSCDGGRRKVPRVARRDSQLGWLIVDLRDNLGGDTEPFQSLIGGMLASPRLRGRGQTIGLANQFTGSSATLDEHCRQQAVAVLIEQPPAARPI